MSKETPNILKKILDYKKEYIENVKRDLPIKELKSMALDCPPARGFTNSILKTIENDKPAIIAEIKKASPSKGIFVKISFHQ